MSNGISIQELKNGDSIAFHKLVDAYQDMVYNTALGIVQQSDDADDITQETFIKAFEKIESFREDASLKSWLYRITVNLSLDHLRKKKSFLGFLSGNKAPHTDFEHPGVQLDKKEEAMLLFRAIEKLPPNQKAAIVLQHLEHLPVAEIAAILNISTPATASLLSRAKENLRTYLTK